MCEYCDIVIIAKDDKPDMIINIEMLYIDMCRYSEIVFQHNRLLDRLQKKLHDSVLYGGQQSGW